jgi:hypothetical protein
METKTWTVASVKNELPDVKVNHNGNISFWRVRGRQNQFAGLYNPITDDHIEAAWETVVNVLNNGKAIIA